MPVFQSVEVKQEVRDNKGDIITLGRTVMVPKLPKNYTDADLASYEAALMEPVCDDALDLGLLVKEDGIPFTKEELEAKRKAIKEKYKERMKEDAKRRKQY